MLLRSVEIYLREERVSAARLGRDALGDPSFVRQLRRGREPRQSTVQKVRAYMRTHQATPALGPREGTS
jgi:2,4-dienoyl-CoA reductase-like NADH-dependent reductase (Old Yellow Enzyme family)